MAMIFDTHAHYDDRRFDDDREAVLASLPTQGIGRVVNIASGMPSVETTLALAKTYEHVYAAIGVHPDETEELNEQDMETLKTYALRYGYRYAADPKHPMEQKVVAIGEIGLEYGREEIVSKPVQKKWFERQLDLSNELNLPVVIHSRDAAKDTYEILKASKVGDGAGIVHCFSYSKEMARQFLDLGYYVALGGVVTFKNGRVAKEVAAYVPDDRLLLETDSPYLSPTPYRGERNTSDRLSYVITTLAEIRGVSGEYIAETTWENANRLYRIRV